MSIILVLFLAIMWHLLFSNYSGIICQGLLEYHPTSVLLKVISCVIVIIVDVSTSVVVNYVFLFTAGTIQITIGTKSILDTVLALIYGTANNNYISDCFTSIRMC